MYAPLSLSLTQPSLCVFLSLSLAFFCSLSLSVSPCLSPCLSELSGLALCQGHGATVGRVREASKQRPDKPVARLGRRKQEKRTRKNGREQAERSVSAFRENSEVSELSLVTEFTMFTEFCVSMHVDAKDLARHQGSRNPNGLLQGSGNR